jgi:hypothetical protein
VTAVRAELLFPLARECHCPPPVVDQMTVPDFGRLMAGLDEMAERDDTEEVT